MTVTKDDVKKFLEESNEWNSKGIEELSKQFTFTNFNKSIQFVNEIASLAELHNHHPDIVITFNKVTLHLTTHDQNGISQKDFELAHGADKLALKL